MNKEPVKLLLAFMAVLLVSSVFLRLVPSIPNFAPIGALALFAGVYGSQVSKWFLLLPVAALMASDMFIGTYEPHVMLAVYGSFLAIGSIGLLVKRSLNTGTVIMGSVTGAVLFFLATNFAVWAFSPWYASGIEGLMASYTMALPFFRASLLGDLFYTGVFFGSYVALKATVPLLYPRTAKA